MEIKVGGKDVENFAITVHFKEEDDPRWVDGSIVVIEIESRTLYGRAMKWKQYAGDEYIMYTISDFVSEKPRELS